MLNQTCEKLKHRRSVVYCKLNLFLLTLKYREKKDLMEKMEPQEIREVSDQRVDKVPLEMPVLLESQETMELLETKDPMV